MRFMFFYFDSVSYTQLDVYKRQILENVSFRLRKGEHIALVGANGEGKSTFLNIITKKLMPDAGNIKWSSRVSVGYLDQHTVLEKGKTISCLLYTSRCV